MTIGVAATAGAASRTRSVWPRQRTATPKRPRRRASCNSAADRPKTRAQISTARLSRSVVQSAWATVPGWSDAVNPRPPTVDPVSGSERP